jgi:hypothetical protein
MSAKVLAMAAKKVTRRPQRRSDEHTRAAPDETEAVQLIAGTLARHEGTIRQLAEVVVNLHANVQALREVVDALTARASDPRISRAKARLRRVKLEE